MRRPLDDAFSSRVRRAIHMVFVYRNPLRAYRHRLMRLAEDPPPVTHRLRNGVALLVDSGPADLRILNEIWIGGAYQRDPRVVPLPGWTVVDLGANKGIYSSWVLHHAVDVTLHCYEPDPHNREFLLANLGPGVRLVSAAVGSTSGEAVFHQVPGNRGLGSTVGARLERRGTATVPVRVPRVSLAEVVERAGGHVDLAKVDIEGSEYDLVMHSDDEVFARIDRIVMEYDAVSPEDSSVTGADLVARLRALGYEVDPGLDAVAKGHGARVMVAVRAGRLDSHRA